MFTAIILMCTLEGMCYTITNEVGFFESESECNGAISDLTSRPDFPTVYQYQDDRFKYNIVDTRCVNWDEKKT